MKGGVMYTLKDVREAALAALAETGDHVYETPEGAGESGTCVYSTLDGQPSCLVGYVFAKIDQEMFSLRHASEWESYERPYSATVYTVLSGAIGASYTQLAVEWLAEAQERQDQGKPWSIAIDRADESVLCLRRRGLSDEAEYLDKIQAEREAS